MIFLQEMLVSDLQLLQATPWIRNHFHLTDLDSTYWESGYYGTCTLIDRRLKVKNVFRVHYTPTKMERDGLFVDIAAGEKTLRFCNTHLESLVADPPLRPAQMTIAARYMHVPEAYASFLAGDLNAIQPFDRTLHSDNGLKDAFIELGGREDSDDGYTWGQQAQTKLREMFGCSRMDKVFYCGDVQLKRLERIGVDVEVEAEDDKQLLKRQGLAKGWVTDHLGLIAEFAISDVDGQAEGELQSNTARL
jgi:tyrosyl-DNA phosphodiesterase 2